MDVRSWWLVEPLVVSMSNREPKLLVLPQAQDERVP
jgi:hypothetical protein